MVTQSGGQTQPDGDATHRGETVTRMRFDAGCGCLNLLATLGRRGAVPVERLRTADDLAYWLVTTGLVGHTPPVTESDLQRVRLLREAAHRVVDAARRERRPDPVDVDELNAWAAEPTAVPQLSADGTTATRESDRPVTAAMAALGRETIELVTGPNLARIRSCAAPECRMLFLDSSRGARRRWCSMSRCGNVAKARAHADRTRQSR